MIKIKGFTLIEVLITALLASFVGMGSLFVISGTNKSLSNGAVEIFKNGNAQSIMYQITTDIHSGAKLVASTYSLLVTDHEDNPKFKWTTDVSGGYANCELRREVYNLDGSVTSKNVLLISSDRRKMVPYVTFGPVQFTAAYHNVDVNTYILEIVEGKTNWESYTRFENRVYCRLNPNAD